MPNTMYFMQCNECVDCTKTSFGYFCERHNHYIDNPEVDGCTWGNEKEVENA